MGAVKEWLKEDYAPECSISWGCSQTSFSDRTVGEVFQETLTAILSSELRKFVTTKPCSVCALCAVCLGGIYRQYFHSGFSMVITVNVGDIWALPRLSCLRRHILGTWQDAGWGKHGRRGTPTSYYPHTGCGARFRGGVAGAEPPHKGGPNRPDRPENRGERKLRSLRPALGTEEGLVVAEIPEWICPDFVGRKYSRAHGASR